MIAGPARMHGLPRAHIHKHCGGGEGRYNEAASAISHLHVNERTSRSNYAILRRGIFLHYRPVRASMSCGICALRGERARWSRVKCCTFSARTFARRVGGSRIETNYTRGKKGPVWITGSYYARIHLFREIPRIAVRFRKLPLYGESPMVKWSFWGFWGLWRVWWTANLLCALAMKIVQRKNSLCIQK